MRKSPLAIAIGMSFFPGVQLATSRVGPISPYRSMLNREIYHRIIGGNVRPGRTMGKTRMLEKNALYPFRYAGGTL